MSADISFNKNIIIRFVFTLPVYLKGIVVLPMLTNLYPQAIYGVWVQIVVIKEIMIYLLSLRLETAIVRYLSAEEYPVRLIKSVYTITLLCSFVFIFLVLIFKKEISQIVFGTSDINSILVTACVWMVVGAFLQIGLAVLRSQEKIRLVSIREVLATAWLIGAVYVAYKLGLDLRSLILICTAGDAVILVWVLIQIGTPFPITSLSGSFRVTKKLLPYTFPLMLNTLFLWFTGSIDKFLIVHFLGLSTVGVYGVALQLTLLLMLVMSPVNFVLFPRATASWNLNNRNEVSNYFSQSVFLTFVLSAPIIIGILIISNQFISLLAGPNYTVSISVMVFLILSEFAKAIYQNHIFVIHLVEKTKYLPFMFIVTAIFNFAACYAFLFFTKFGITGAACSRFITYGLMAAIITFWARKYIKFDIAWKTIFLVMLSACIMGVSIFWMPMKNWYQLSVTILTGIFIFVIMIFSFRVLTIDKLVLIKNTFSTHKTMS